MALDYGIVSTFYVKHIFFENNYCDILTQMYNLELF
jgi:hypothetical protein